jgi:hypothetical protein
MTTLLILNDPPYGTERSYNGLRLALSLAKVEGSEVRVFLMGDAIGCAKREQKTPPGYYNLERMLKGLAAKVHPDRRLRHMHGRPRLHRGRASGRRPPLLDGRAGYLDP